MARFVALNSPKKNIKGGGVELSKKKIFHHSKYQKRGELKK